LRQSQSSDRFEDDAIGPSLGVGLNKFQNLLALLNAVRIRIQDFHVHRESARSLFGGSSLFHLVIVVLRDQRDHNPESLHISPN